MMSNLTTKEKVKSQSNKIDSHAIRNWKLYVIQFTDGMYYIGIAAYKDVHRRIRQHGSNKGALWARGKVLAQIVEMQELGRVRRNIAEKHENDITLAYRKKFGRKRVRGGYNSQMLTSLVPTFSPGSKESVRFVIGSITVAVALLTIIAIY